MRQARGEGRRGRGKEGEREKRGKGGGREEGWEKGRGMFTSFLS